MEIQEYKKIAKQAAKAVVRHEKRKSRKRKKEGIREN